MPTPSRWRGGRMCPSVSRLDQYRMRQLPSCPHTLRGLVGQLHMLRTCSCSSKRALISIRVVSLNTSQSSLRTLQRNLTALSGRSQGVSGKQTGWAFINGSSWKSHFLNWCVSSPEFLAEQFVHKSRLSDTRHVKHTSFMTASPGPPQETMYNIRAMHVFTYCKDFGRQPKRRAVAQITTRWHTTAGIFINTPGAFDLQNARES